MDNNSIYEQEINLKDLVFAVLYKWKLILVMAVVFAVALGGYKGFSTYKSKTAPDKVLEATDTYNKNLETYTRNKEAYEREIANLEKNIIEQDEYLKNSIWAQLSPYNICEAHADLYIATEPGSEYTEDVLVAYKSMISDESIMEKLAEEVGTKARYVKELLSVEHEMTSERMSRILSISVKHNTTEDAEKMLNALLEQLEVLKPSVESTIGAHSIEVVSKYVSVDVDLSQATVRTDLEKKVTELTKSLTTKQDALKALTEPKMPANAVTTALKSAVKFAVLGGVGGACVVVFVVCALFLMNTSVYSAKELKDRCKVKLLGVLPTGGKKKCPVDAWLRKLDGRVQVADEETNYRLIATNIQNSLGDVKTILVTGCTIEEKIVEVVERITAELPELQFICGGNMLKNADALQKLPVCDAVILVEQCRVSQYGDIDQEIESVKDLKKCIVGCIVID